ncbi:MAG: hypothetical protein R2788_05470 [Saprospiraceae bacterium]
MKTNLALPFLVLLCYFFQKTVFPKPICGILNDANGPLPFASVLLLQPSDSSLVKGDVTRDDSFSIQKVVEGNYLRLL